MYQIRIYTKLLIDNTQKMAIATSVILNANPLDQFSEFQIGLKRTADLNEEEWLDQVSVSDLFRSNLLYPNFRFIRRANAIN